MNNKKIKAITDSKNLCYKCLKKKKINEYRIYGRGYGSNFDNCHAGIQICDECKENNPLDLWFYETPKQEKGDYYETYLYESEIDKFVGTFPLEGQELFYNGIDGYTIDSQDWIDMELGILPDEKYEDYGFYSPRQIKAYNEKFTTCEYTINKEYDDGSIGCYCPFGASGNKDQIADEYNISVECYSCKYHKLRHTPIRTINEEDFNDYEIYIKYKIKEEKLKSKFE